MTEENRKILEARHERHDKMINTLAFISINALLYALLALYLIIELKFSK